MVVLPSPGAGAALGAPLIMSCVTLGEVYCRNKPPLFPFVPSGLILTCANDVQPNEMRMRALH